MAHEEYCLIEINPRFPAWCDFPSTLNCNLPAAALELALGWQPREPLRRATPGKFFIRHAIDMTGDLRDLAALTTTGQLIRQPREFIPHPARRPGSLISNLHRILP
jgi:carbamoyl-phosphate synthase large subunit